MSMWGSSFADIAKKAQEAAQAAQEASENLSSNIQSSDVSSYFNLDAMISQNGSNDEKDPSQKASSKPQLNDTKESSTIASIPEKPPSFNVWNTNDTNDANEKKNGVLHPSKDSSLSTDESPTITSLPPPTPPTFDSDDFFASEMSGYKATLEENRVSHNTDNGTDPRDLTQDEMAKSTQDELMDESGADKDVGDEWDFNENEDVEVEDTEVDDTEQTGEASLHKKEDSPLSHYQNGTTELGIDDTDAKAETLTDTQSSCNGTEEPTSNETEELLTEESFNDLSSEKEEMVVNDAASDIHQFDEIPTITTVDEVINASTFEPNQVTLDDEQSDDAKLEEIANESEVAEDTVKIESKDSNLHEKNAINGDQNDNGAESEEEITSNLTLATDNENADTDTNLQQENGLVDDHSHSTAVQLGSKNESEPSEEIVENESAHNLHEKHSLDDDRCHVEDKVANDSEVVQDIIVDNGDMDNSLLEENVLNDVQSAGVRVEKENVNESELAEDLVDNEGTEESLQNDSITMETHVAEHVTDTLQDERQLDEDIVDEDDTISNDDSNELKPYGMSTDQQPTLDIMEDTNDDEMDHDNEVTHLDETIIIGNQEKESTSLDLATPVLMDETKVNALETTVLDTSVSDSGAQLTRSDVEDSVDDIDDMYDDEEETDNEESEADAVPIAPANESGPTVEATEDVMTEVPQFAIEKFMSQLERLHVQHEAELQDMEKRHKTHIEDMKTQLDTANASIASQKKAKSKEEVIAYDKALAQQRQLEKDFNAKLLEKEELNHGLQKQNELLVREINEVKSDVNQLKSISQKRDGELVEMDQMKQKIKELEENLSKTQTELDSSNDAYTTLKARVKTVALELKERRVECRGLTATSEELKATNMKLQEERDEYRSKSSILSNENEKKDDAIAALETQNSKIELDLRKMEKTLTEKGAVGDKALAAYKRKAQASLANANARAAAANQSREEAEIDASNARNEADIAKVAAKEAEEDKKMLVSKAEEEVKVLRNEISDKVSKIHALQEDVSRGKEQYTDVMKEVSDMRKDKEVMIEELHAKEFRCKEGEEKKATLQQELDLNRIKMKSLQDELDFLKEEMEKNASVAFMARQSEANEMKTETTSQKEYIGDKKTEIDGTIINLQQELGDANDAIRGLKEVLATILLKNPSLKQEIGSVGDLSPTKASFSPGCSFDDTENVSLNQRSFEVSPARPRDNKNDSTPLFFAIEKQAELNTAREEINRLAGLLGDAETAKTEAFDAMEDMRKKMEEAESRLRRYEKLGPGGKSAARSGVMMSSGTRRHPANGSMAFHGPITSRVNNGFGEKMSSQNDSTVNLEYLKNIILRYLNAQTVAEKKSLVPVIAAVLELTADEVSQAIKAQEASFQFW